MDKLIPFFYYDILSRMVPGAVTLATLFMIRDRLPPSWSSFFAGEQSWKAIVVPLLLGGLCYVVGVIYEVTDYSPLAKWNVLGSDDKAFAGAWDELSDYIDKNHELLKDKTTEQIRRFRFRLWDALVFMGGRRRDLSSVFAHSHRFQAEYKMFLHLIYPTFLFVMLCVARCFPIRAFIGLGTILVLFYFSHLRNQRRWMQALSFAQQLQLIERCARDSSTPISFSEPAETDLKGSDSIESD